MLCGNTDIVGWMWLFGLLWFLLIGGGIALVVWAIARGTGSNRHIQYGDSDRALAALRERFARGDIDEVEYQQRRRVLASHDGE